MAKLNNSITYTSFYNNDNGGCEGCNITISLPLNPKINSLHADQIKFKIIESLKPEINDLLNKLNKNLEDWFNSWESADRID